MATSYYVQAGSSLQKITSTGVVSTLTLPANVTIDATIRGRFAVLKRKVVFVGASTRNLIIDPYTDAVYPLTLRAPQSTPIASVGAAGVLTGDYAVIYTHGIKDLDSGEVISESPYSPPSNSIALTADRLHVAAIEQSPDADTNFRRVYRTLTGGVVYFPWIDVDGNVETETEGDVTDAQISLIAAPGDLGAPPGTYGDSGLHLITAWKSRLWARDRLPSQRVDVVRWSAANKVYAWPVAYAIDIPPVGADKTGITAFMPRRDELGICKRDSVHKITGNSESDFRRVTVAEGIGCIAPESVCVIDDVGYFLGTDGVYAWTSDVKSISKEKVHPWFTSDTYFNRSQFPNARAKYNRVLGTYELHLAAAGSSVLDRWVSYDLKRKEWFGPHKTDLMTPAAVGVIQNASDIDVPIICSTDGYFYVMNQGVYSDVGATSVAIDYDVTTAWFSGNVPKIAKMWGFLSLISKIQAAGTLTVTPTVGKTNASAQAAISHDLTLGTQKLRRLGLGELMKLRLRHNTAGQACTVLGLECPFFEVGHRS